MASVNGVARGLRPCGAGLVIQAEAGFRTGDSRGTTKIRMRIDRYAPTTLLVDFLPNHPCRGDTCCFARIARRRSRTDCSDRKSTRLNSSHVAISYAVFCLKK